MPRYTDVQGVLRRYPDVTHEERVMLKLWYRRARFSEFVPALNDPTVEAPLARLRRDLMLDPELSCKAASARSAEDNWQSREGEMDRSDDAKAQPLGVPETVEGQDQAARVIPFRRRVAVKEERPDAPPPAAA